MKHLLSKSKYLLGLQCPRYLWTAMHDKKKIPEPDEVQMNIFEQGHLIGEIAKKWYPDGIDISCDRSEFIKNMKIYSVFKCDYFAAPNALHINFLSLFNFNSN